MYFNSVAEYEGIPESYRYIRLDFRNVKSGTPLYEALQKGVYMGFFKNLPIDLKVNEPATKDQFAKAVESNLGQHVEIGTGALTLKTVLDTLDGLYREQPGDNTSGGGSGTISPTLDTGAFYPITTVPNFAILNDVYQKLKYNYYDSSKLHDEALIQGAAKGMAEASGDKHTAYFPPVESKNFQDELGGEFEGIGAYIDMPKPGELHIISPMSDTPAEKSGLK